VFITSLILSLVGLAGIVIGRLKGYGQLGHTPYRRIYGDAPGAWDPEER
jgi:hypothetical protein